MRIHSEQDKYVPVFDPRYDTFDSVRGRSPMLFDVICAVGCRAECGEYFSLDAMRLERHC